MQVEQNTQRRGRDKDPLVSPKEPPQPTDIDAKLTALRRRTAAITRPKEKSERMLQLQQSSSPALTPTPSSHRADRSPKMPSGTPRNHPASPRRHASPQVGAPRHTHEADHEDFSRRLKISTSPPPRSAQPRASTSKLYNPDSDPIPKRRIPEPESVSDEDNKSYAPRVHHSGMPSREERSSAPRQLFDHRKDDPVRFSVLARPQQSSSASRKSAPNVSASSTSSYAPSIASSAFTLSSTTDASSASSAIFDGQPNPSHATSDSGNNLISMQLKKLYRGITALETKIKQEDASDDPDDLSTSRVMLKGKEIDTEELEKEKWKKQIADHKRLAETIHGLLEISLAPSVPASLRNIPTKYNIIVRLWTYAFHKILESLRQASFGSQIAMEHLQEFIYYAYTFYTGLLEEPILALFKSGWLEALGDLARYRMAVAAMVSGGVGGQGGLTASALSLAAAQSATGDDDDACPSSPKSVSDYPAARIDDSPSPSTGVAAARMLDVEPEKERWRNIARDWYGAGLAEQPGTGKLHHHLGLLSREVESEELRAVYHYLKSMTTLHPFSTSRESVLPIWSHAAQARRSGPEARVSELFLLMHGMLFTNIQLDDFQPTLARFIERLDIEGAEEREWIMMGIINIAAVLEYGRPTSTLRKVGMVGTREASGPQIAAAMRLMSKRAGGTAPSGNEERMDVDDEGHREPIRGDLGGSGSDNQSPTSDSFPTVQVPVELSPGFKNAVQLTFAMLSHVLRRPMRKPSQYAKSNINPYLTVILTFLATVLKHKPTLEVLEKSIPWDELATFFATIPRKIMVNQGLMASPTKPYSKPTEPWSVLTSQCSPPLPEDWCLRGMEWVVRKVFERGYWKSDEDRKAELEVLETVERGDLTDGMIEDDDDDEGGRGPKPSSSSTSSGSDLVRRWIRTVRCAVSLAEAVDGFEWKEGTREWGVGGKLAEKLQQWKEEDRLEKEEEERRRMGRRWVDDVMDVDEDAEDSISEDDSEDNENDSEEIKALKARRRHLKGLLQQQSQSLSGSRPSKGSKSKDSRPPLHVVPGYTVLVIDTNILLSSLSIISSLIESARWTVVVPLPVVMELDGIRNNTSQLGDAAKAALEYISSHIRTHASSLKVLTSRGNYLTSLNVRSEEVNFDNNSANAEKSMDDLILKAAIWQDDHWVDRSKLLNIDVSSVADLPKAVKVVLLSLDRNLRLKARSRQLPAASEKDLASILVTAT